MVLDFNMPGLDGSQVAEVLMKDYPKLPVVICSGCLDDIPEGLKWFADALLEKADGPEALISAIERLVPAGSVINKIIPRITVRTAERLSA